MTAFFLPDVPAPEMEPAYARIRAETEVDTGHVISDRRISALACRRDGKDYEAKVGMRDQVADRVVVAIFDLGRNAYAIRFDTSAEPLPSAGADAIVVEKNQVYSVTYFAT